MSDIVERLPCDVLVQPATLIKRGCRIETLLECIEMRRERSEKGPPLDDILSRRQADEILALRKEVERLEVNGIHTCHVDCQRVACVLRRENEALKVALRACRHAVGHGTPEPRRNVREIVDEALAPARAALATEAE